MVIQTTFSEPNSFGQVAAAVEVLVIRQTFIVLVMVDEAVAAAEAPLESKLLRNHVKAVAVQVG